MENPKENEEEIKELNPGECSKDSDCGIGKVCVGGRCVDDIGAVKSES